MLNITLVDAKPYARSGSGCASWVATRSREPGSDDCDDDGTSRARRRLDATTTDSGRSRRVTSVPRQPATSLSRRTLPQDGKRRVAYLAFDVPVCRHLSLVRIAGGTVT